MLAVTNHSIRYNILKNIIFKTFQCLNKDLDFFWHSNTYIMLSYIHKLTKKTMGTLLINY